MFPKNIQDPEYPSSKGSRKDGQNLVSEWLKTKKVNGRFRILRVLVMLCVCVQCELILFLWLALKCTNE